MQKLKLLVPLALFIGAFFVACHEEDDFPGYEKMARVTFAGQIIDENGDGVPGAFVKAGDKSAVTDNNGVFRLDPVDLPANHAILSVTGTGFFDYSRAYVVQDNALQNVTIQLLVKEIMGLVNASSGGAVDVNGGPKLIFPANAVTDQQGNAFTGTVQVLAKYIDPKSPTLGLRMPGDLTGLNLAGEKRSLSTYGMVAVELESSTGQKLKIASNSEVEIRMPIDASIVSSAPSEIPLWHYDLEKAYWIEEGVAQKIGNEYVGKVKHFSYWNYDGSLPSVNVTGKVYLGDTDHPLAGVSVTIRPEDPAAGWGCGHGDTNGDGVFGGAVSKDILLHLEVSTWDFACGGQTLYSAQIGPFSADASLPDIIIPSQAIQSLTVSGRLLDCNGQPVPNGYAKMSIGATNNFIFAAADGTFDYTTTICTSSNQSGTVVGYDLSNLLESPPTPFNFPPNTFNVGDITICSTLSEFIRFSLDGAPDVVKVSPFGGLDANLTIIQSQDSTTVNQGIRFSFINNGQTGTFPLSYLDASNFYFDPQAPNTLSTTVTAAGNIGDLIIGSFGGSFNDSNGGSHTINGSYRVIREW